MTGNLDGGVGSATDRIYGRSEEAAQIREALQEIAGGGSSASGRVILLTGTSGVGKSTMALKAIEMAGDLGFEVYRTACEPFHEGMSYFPVRELVRQISQGHSVSSIVSEIFGPDSPQAEIASVSESPSADAASRREALVATFTNVIFGRFSTDSGQPLLLFIDDLEHLDAGSADALICLVARLREGPVVLLGAYRSDLVTHSSHPVRAVVSSARRDGVLLDLTLEQFPERALAAITEVILGGECDLPPAFYDKLHRETEGNPLFIREVLRTLQNPDGAGDPPLAQRDGVWRYSGSIDLWAVPSTVEDVIASRLDLLDPDQRRELELAAVIGRRFAFEVFSELMSAGEDVLLEHLDGFLNLDLIRELDEKADSFEFSHGKIRDVLYESLSGLRRRKMHAQVADVLRSLQGVTNEDWDALIGGHLFQAAKNAEAFPLLLRAARSARVIGSARDAVGLFKKALVASESAVFDANDSKNTVRLELAEALLASSNLSEAGGLLERLIEPGTEDDVRAWALNYRGDVLLRDGEVEAAITQFAECERLAREAENLDLIAEVCCDLGELHGRQHERLAGIDPEASERHREIHDRYTSEAFRLVDHVTGAEARARILRNTAKSARVAGNVDRAIELYEQALSAVDARAAGHRFLVPYAKTLRLAGRSADAKAVVDRVLAWSTQIGSRRSEAIAWQYKGLLLMMDPGEDGTLDVAQECLMRAHQQHRVNGFRQGLYETEMLLGELALRKGDQATAYSWFERSIGNSSLSRREVVDAAVAELVANGELDRAEFVRAGMSEES